MAITYARDIPDFKEKVEEYSGGISSGPIIEIGSTPIITVGSNSIQDTVIELPNEMPDTAYYVGLTLNNQEWGGQGVGQSYNKFIGVKNKTKTSFTIHLIHFGSTTWNASFDWVAIHK